MMGVTIGRNSRIVELERKATKFEIGCWRIWRCVAQRASNSSMFEAVICDPSHVCSTSIEYGISDSFSWPASARRSWFVRATPAGELSGPSLSEKAPALFWEGRLSWMEGWRDEGFVLSACDVSTLGARREGRSGPIPGGVLTLCPGGGSARPGGHGCSCVFRRLIC
jgi:hypothetical protein